MYIVVYFHPTFQLGSEFRSAQVTLDGISECLAQTQNNTFPR